MSDVSIELLVYDTYYIMFVYTVPTPTTTLMIPTSDYEPLYEGTLQTMTCTVTLPDTVDTNVNVNIDWILDTNIIITTSDRIIISPVSSLMSPFISTLTFDPLIMSDAGQYYCQATADSSSQYITTSTTPGNSLVETIIVTGIYIYPPIQ